MVQIVQCVVYRRDDKGNVIRLLQAFEIVNGVRRPTSTPPPNASPKGRPTKEKFK